MPFSYVKNVILTCIVLLAVEIELLLQPVITSNDKNVSCNSKTEQDENELKYSLRNSSGKFKHSFICND